MARKPGTTTGEAKFVGRAGNDSSPTVAHVPSPSAGRIDGKSTADTDGSERHEARARRESRGNKAVPQDEYDLGVVVGVGVGILAPVVGVFWSMQTMVGFTEAAPGACVPIAALYSIPLGIAGAKLGRRAGTETAAQRNSIIGAVAGGVLALGLTVFIMKFIEALGQ